MWTPWYLIPLLPEYRFHSSLADQGTTHVAAMCSAQNEWFNDGAYGIVSNLTAHGRAYTFIGHQRAYGPRRNLKGNMQTFGRGSTLLLTIEPEWKLQARRMVSSGRLKMPAIATLARTQQYNCFEEPPQCTTSTPWTEKLGQREHGTGLRRMPSCC